MRKVGWLLGLVVPLMAGYYQTPNYRVRVWLNGGQSYTDSVNLANRSLWIQDVSWIPAATVHWISTRQNCSFNVDVTHNATTFSYNDGANNNPGPTNTWVGQRANGLWITTVTNVSAAGCWDEWRDWTMEIAFLPTVQIVSPANGGYISGTFPLRVNTTGTQQLTVFLEDATGGIWTVQNWLQNPLDNQGTIDWNYINTYDTRLIPDGVYTLYAIGLDNESLADTDSVQLTVDNTPPTVGPYAPLDGATVTGSVVFSVNAYDAIALKEVTLSVDGDAPVVMNWNATSGRYETTLNTANYNDGVHTITYTAVDSAGNVTTHTLTVTFDQTPPTAAVLSPQGGAYLAGSSSIVVQAQDNLGLSGVQLTFGGTLASLGTVNALYDAGTGTYTYTLNTALFNDGPATVQATVTDQAGLSSTSAQVSFWVDNHAPTLQVLDPQDGTVHAGSLSVSILASDANGISSVNPPTLQVDGGPALPFQWVAGDTFTVIFNTADYADGQHTLLMTVQDSAGRVTQASRTVTFDNTAPTVAVLAPNDNVYVSDTLWVRVQASDASGVDRVDLTFGGVLSSLGTRQATLDPATGLYVFPVDTRAFADGAASVQATAYDPGGLSTQTAVVNFFVDNAAPNVQVLSPADSAVVSGDVTLQVLAFDDAGIASVDVSLDGGPYQAMTQVGASDTFTLVLPTATYTEGTHDLVVRARSTTGAEQVLHQTLVFDNTAPTVALVNPQQNAHVRGVLQVQGTAADNLGLQSVRFVFGGVLAGMGTVDAAYNAVTDQYELPVDTRNVPDGSGQVVIQARDHAGWVSTDTVIFTVDNTAPTARFEIQGITGDTIVPNTPYTVRIVTSEPLVQFPYFAFLPEGYDTVLLAAQQVSDTEYTATLQMDGSTGDVRVQFLFRGQDAAGNVGQAITTGEWFFLNVQAPVLTHQPVDMAVAAQDLTITITTGGSRNIQAKLYYKGHFEDNYRVMSFTGTNPLIVTIPGDEVGLQGLDYYIEATNEEGTVTRFATPDQPHYVKVVAFVENGQTYDDGIYRLSVPAGALPQGQKIGLSMPFARPSVPADLPFTGYFLQLIGPANLQQPVHLTLSYRASDVVGMNEDMLKAIRTSDGSVFGEAQPDARAHKLTIQLTGSLADTTNLAFVEKYVALDSLALLPKANVFMAPSPIRDVQRATLTFFLNPQSGQPLPDQVIVEIYDISGDPVARWTLAPSPGLNRVTWDVSRIPRGLYIFRVKAGSEEVVKRVAVIK